MGLTSSLFTGLSGMKNNEYSMDVIGDNIANVNTYAYKSSRVTFQNQFLKTFSFGTSPTATNGGSNPLQVGTGSAVAQVTRDFTDGSPESTGRNTDMAVLGQGMLILQQPDGTRVYTRDGSMSFNSENYLVSADGYFLQGYAVDGNFNLVEGSLARLRIPLGEITTATRTSLAHFSGDLNGNGVNQAVYRPVSTTANALITAAGSPPTPATEATLMTALVDTAGNPMFYDGNILTMVEGEKGGATLPEREFAITAATTVQDYMDWLDATLGIVTETDLTTDDPGLKDLSSLATDPLNPDASHQMPGVRINANGYLVITGNIGSSNNIGLPSGAILASQGTAATAPPKDAVFAFEQTVVSTTEGTRTSFTGYDSLGVPIEVTLTFALETADGNGITWRFFAESSDDTDADRFLGTGLIQFDTKGNYTSTTNATVTIDRDDTGSQTPQSVTFDFSAMKGYTMNNAISLLSQDGFPSGTLQDFSIGQDGIITGSFTNGQTRTLGQVVLATFRNYEGLIAQGQNLYFTGPNSGDAIIKRPEELGAGSIASGSLELSNVDLSREFINLIISSTGFSASSRVIQTSNQLLTELITMTR